MGVILASLAAVLLYATARDRTEGKLQTSSVRASYAAEAAVAVGVETLRAELADSTTAPNLLDVAARTRASVVAALPDASFPTLSVRYFDAATNSTSVTPFGSSTLGTISGGPNNGLRAQQTPIQVFAVAQVDKATASIADAVRIDLIPVFQFAMFFDGDFDLQSPAPITIAGRVHTNGDFYVGGGSATAFRGNITIAKTLRGHAAYNTGVKVGVATISKADGTGLNLSSGFPFGSSPYQGAAQSDEIKKWNGTVNDASTGAQPLSLPLRLRGATSCSTSALCGTGRSCVKVRASDANGVCTNDVVSRPDKCGKDSSTSAAFAQSLAVELVKRPASDYGSASVTAPYGDVTRADASGRPLTSPYSVEFGPRPSMTARTKAEIVKVDVPRSVPLMTSTTADDDPGAVLDRMYWKADIRIVDGVWYRKGVTGPVFDPERDAYAPAEVTPLVTDWKHLFARTIRYSWWWDGRENRVYCKTGTVELENCVSNSDNFQRGGQIRAADFDVAAFMALLDNTEARTKLFPSGALPADGVIIYMSETYDPTFEDANTKLPPTANVRNFLNFSVMHSDTFMTAHAALDRRAPARNSLRSGLRPPNPYQVGWLPERLWGRNAPLNFESLTRTAIGTEANQLVGYAAPVLTTDNGSGCLVPGGEYTSSASVRPASRPTSFATPQFAPPCIQAGATPLGPENAVRILRATSLPSGGFTFVTDNRLYLHGDINVRGDSTIKTGNNFTTFQDISGSVSLMADSLTLQSSRFSDREFQGGAFDHAPRLPTGYTNRTWSGSATGVAPYSTPAPVGEAPTSMCTTTNRAPFETYINASLLMGDVPPCINGGNAVGSPGGGVNNFPRFVENWGTVPLTINGSIVGLFRSERGNARFQDSGYSGGFSLLRSNSGYPNALGTCIYTPPDLKWSFDNTLLASSANLPPGTPRVVATDRLRWVRR